jgi:ribosomal protein L37AE/L43A
MDSVPETNGQPHPKRWIDMTDVTTVELSEFTCPECNRTTQDPHDVKARYCSWCHWWTGDPVMARVPRDAPVEDAGVTRLREDSAAARVIRGVARVRQAVGAGRRDRAA